MSFLDDAIAAARTRQRLAGCDCDVQISLLDDPDENAAAVRVAYQHELGCRLARAASARSN